VEQLGDLTSGDSNLGPNGTRLAGGVRKLGRQTQILKQNPWDGRGAGQGRTCTREEGKAVRGVGVRERLELREIKKEKEKKREVSDPLRSCLKGSNHKHGEEEKGIYFKRV